MCGAGQVDYAATSNILGLPDSQLLFSDTQAASTSVRKEWRTGVSQITKGPCFTWLFLRAGDVIRFMTGSLMMCSYGVNL